MNIPINWLKELVKLPEDQKKLTDDLTMIGHMLDKTLEINNQIVLDLELRGNRADCYSILGIAREVGAVYNTKVKNLPIIDNLKVVKKLKNSNLDIQTNYVKRAAMIEIYDVKITKSPKWLKEKIEMCGIESINNIVDLTNYIMIETGEPTHAFDLDKVKGGLEIRLAKDEEKITTFQEKKLTLTKEDLVWSQGSKILSVAGAIGEKYHSISDSTKNILLEAANYDRANIRKTVYRHNLLTEAGIRHEKELDPNMVLFAIGRFLYFIKKYNWGRFRPEVFDHYLKPIKSWNIKLSLAYLDKLSGMEIPRKEILKILRSLNFKILNLNKDSILVSVPTYRTDVVLEEDIIEEIVRIYGYNNIPANTLSLPVPVNITPNYIKQETKVREATSAIGFSESITLSFVEQKQSKLNNSPTKGREIVSLINPSSPDTKNMRISLLPNLYQNIKKTIYQFSEHSLLFEIGKVYFKEKSKYKEERKLGLIYWENQTANGGNFKKFKTLILGIFEKLGIESPEFENEIFNIPLHHSYNLKIKDKIVGFGGEIQDIFYAEIDLDSILETDKKSKVTLWPKYPPQIEDITLTLPQKTKVGNVIQLIKSVSSLISKVELKDIFKDSYTFNIWYQNPKKTLNNKEVEKIRDEILKKLKSKFGINSNRVRPCAGSDPVV